MLTDINFPRVTAVALLIFALAVTGTISWWVAIVLWPLTTGLILKFKD